MNDLLPQILRCPISKGSLKWMCPDEVETLNHHIADKTLKHWSGNLVERQVEAVLVTEDGQLAYMVEDGIPVLLSAAAIVLKKNEFYSQQKQSKELRQEKEAVQQFYDQVGWHKQEESVFTDAVKFEDLRPVSQEYIRRCNLRVNRYLVPEGRYLLDVASGPLQFPEYVRYSNSFEYRICVDLSLVALKEASRKLGDKAICLLADITNLPLIDNLVDNAISLHTIYHVPKDEQQLAFEEIFRVLKPKSTAVIVYHWGDYSLLMNTLMFHYQVARLIRKAFRMIRKTTARQPASTGPKLYFHAHRYSWFTQPTWNLPFELVSWRSVSVPFLKFYIHPRLFGRRLLRLIQALEERFPRLAGRIGQYPMFVIRK